MMTLPYWGETLSHVVSLALAYALALPVGWDREKDERSAGIRTFPLVAIASCGFVLVGIAILGVGFIGGGAILKYRGKASGTATAASLWSTGALGAAVGYGLYDIAVVLSLTTFLTLRFSHPLKRASQNHLEPADRQ
jgi:putative Mg2+ transporter-C (MgtC) family protein